MDEFQKIIDRQLNYYRYFLEQLRSVDFDMRHDEIKSDFSVEFIKLIDDHTPIFNITCGTNEIMYSGSLMINAPRHQLYEFIIEQMFGSTDGVHMIKNSEKTGLWKMMCDMSEHLLLGYKHDFIFYLMKIHRPQFMKRYEITKTQVKLGLILS